MFLIWDLSKGVLYRQESVREAKLEKFIIVFILLCEMFVSLVQFYFLITGNAPT